MSLTYTHTREVPLPKLQAREKRARREAERRGLILRKSRKDGTWLVIATDRSAVVAGGQERMSLPQVERYLGLRK
jgi:hypothetical protein